MIGLVIMKLSKTKTPDDHEAIKKLSTDLRAPIKALFDKCSPVGSQQTKMDYYVRKTQALYEELNMS